MLIRKSKSNLIPIAFYLFLVFQLIPILGQSQEDETYADVFKVMQEVLKPGNNKLWPLFNPSEIPVLIYDNQNTYLFNSMVKPKDFITSEKDSGVYMYFGQYPLVRGNSIEMLNNSLIATSILSRESKRFGTKYEISDMAGIIIHEQFHVFQKLYHSHWRQNDGLLLYYPEETWEAIFLRRMEREGFRRSVSSNNPRDIIGWAKEAFKYRDQRLRLVDPKFRVYEKELQRTEGLSDYIEKVARGLNPFSNTNFTNGIAPSGIRDLGYVEGRWIAIILDKVKPDWKQTLECADSLYLEDILRELVSKSSVKGPTFSLTEIQEEEMSSRDIYNNWIIEKKEKIDKYNTDGGFKIEINSSRNPLYIKIFEPLRIEIIDTNIIFHEIIFSANNDQGSLRIKNYPCITHLDNSLRVNKVIICGLINAPTIDSTSKLVTLNYKDISIELKYTKLTINNETYLFEL